MRLLVRLMKNIPDLVRSQGARIIRIAESYRQYSGRLLVTTEGCVVEALWRAPMVIVAHDTAPDPIFFFGNLAALTLFEMDFATFTQVPSRFSAEPMLRDERARLLERVNRHGLIDDYSGVRISSTGKRFRIERASVWNVVDGHGNLLGQAAAFTDWSPIEG